MLTFTQYFRLVLKKQVTLIHERMQKSKMNAIIALFQKEAEVMTIYSNIASLQYLISTTRLINVEYTLTKAKRLVIFEPEWMKRDTNQIKMRINRIDQTEFTFTYSLYILESNVEEAVFDR